MGSLAYDLALVHHNDLVCVHNRADALSYYDYRCFPGLFFEPCAQDSVGLVVQSREAVIEYINIRFADDGSGNR